jgi:hypothetical protein
MLLGTSEATSDDWVEENLGVVNKPAFVKLLLNVKLLWLLG